MYKTNNLSKISVNIIEKEQSSKRGDELTVMIVKQFTMVMSGVISARELMNVTSQYPRA